MESESFLTPRKLIQSALARTSSRTSMASSPSLMAVRTPTLSRTSTSSNSTSSRFNLLPVLQTPPSRIFKGRIVNPFEPHLVERLHLPMIGSPSLFHRPSTPQNSSLTQFEWTIDEVSSLGPANVEPHETQFLETPDPVAEARVQAAISTYFKEHSIVPSPIDCPLRKQKIVLSQDSRDTSTSEGAAGYSKRKLRDGLCQTVLTFPPNLPKAVEDMLQQYLTYNESQQQQHSSTLNESSASSIDHDARDASLRRKLFNTSAVQDEIDSEAGRASRFGTSIDDFDLRALSPAPESPEVLVTQGEQPNEQELKRSRYYGSQEMLSHILESDGDSSFGALSPISKSSLSPSSPNESPFEQHYSDLDAIYRSTPEPSTAVDIEGFMSPDLNGSRLFMSGSIKHTELTKELAEANLSNEGEKSLVLSSQSSDCSQLTQHSITPQRGFRRKENRRTNRKNLSQSFLQISDKERIDGPFTTDSACEMSCSAITPMKVLSPIKEINVLDNVLRSVNFYRTDSGFNEESQITDFAHELSDVSMVSEDFSNTPCRKNKTTVAVGNGTESCSNNEATMGHGHGHGPPYKVPDASIYKVADAPELVEVERALARRGLKDPWLRNEVWRYNVKQFSTHRSRLVTFLFKGFPLGFAAFVATIGVEYALGVDYHGGHGHGNGHGHGDEKGHGSGHH
uniref:Protein aurora borealis n=1 Tax=Anopheles dirus TaxID=7168 RepID=A0A182MYS8_9DIPT